MENITVKVTKHGNRKFLAMYYDDPFTGKRETRSTKKTTRKEALVAAGEWQNELRSGRYKPPSQTTWEEFRKRYEDEVLTGKAPATEAKCCAVFDAFEKETPVVRLRDITASRLSQYAAKQRENKRAEATIALHLRVLGGALRWGVQMGMLSEAPKIRMPKPRKGQVMKGRPICTEEFERMLEAVQGEVGEAVVPGWKFLLRGLWLSGLRLGEALNLHWDRDDMLSVDLAGRRPMLRIPGELEKGGQTRLLPMTPDFAEFLQAVPEGERTGPVFKLLAQRKNRPNTGKVIWVSEVICRIGKAAGVKVNTAVGTGKVKYASAHDLRRSFGARWSTKLMPVVLQELMRHEDIETTMKYYVGKNAAAMADEIWAAVGKVDTFVDTRASGEKKHAETKLGD